MRYRVFNTRLAVVSIAALLIYLSAGISANASVRSMAITAAVNTSACPSTAPVLVNGGFEDFSNPATDVAVASGTEGSSRYGLWHGYAQGPNQILFLKPTATPATGETANYVTGWRSTSSMIEIQRQVESYTSSVNNLGSPAYSGQALSGVATSGTSSTNPSDYFDKFGPQAAEGTYWAELNAISNSALFQDIEVPSSAQLFWSIKHRGRTNTNEEMSVSIGPVVNNSATVSAQTALQKYAPTNVDKFVGSPTYGTSTSESRIVSNLNDGWNRFEGTYPADTNAGAPPTRILRFQFGSVRGGNGWDSFGNLLDDIQFVPFLACPVTRSLQVGDTESIDVTGPVTQGSSSMVSYGLRQSLDGIGNPTAPASEFSTSSNTVTFTPSQAGTFTVDYQVEMMFAGTSYTTASRITYEVSPNPSASPSTGNQSTAGTPSSGTESASAFGNNSTTETTSAPSINRQLPRTGMSALTTLFLQIAVAVLAFGGVLTRFSSRKIGHTDSPQ